MESILNWVDERIEIRSIWAAIMERNIPIGVNWWYTLGSATLFLFTLQAVTGMFLAMYYSPSPDHAYDSIEFIMNAVIFGRVVRGLHHWGASAMVVLATMHMLRVFVMGAYKYPREMTWAVGVVLLLLTLGFGFTGYLLPWDEKAYWATTVGTNMAGTVPYVGDFLMKVTRGGSELGAVTLTRFYAAHMLLLPAATLLFITVHLFMVIKQGISAPPKLQEADDWGMQAPGSGTSLNRGTSLSGTGEEQKSLEVPRPKF
ncbi:MAG: cytochrome b N-terminal domain-containing protein [Dehalococcoidia bacterium]|nr:cytochrome b N-terminal domain-containing protein [Dehalococcoidia bacterium]